MGTRALLIALAASAVAVGSGAAAVPADATCGTSGCGVPSCTSANVRARPDMARDVAVWCSYADSATLLQQPAHGTVSNVTTQWGAVRFSVHMASDAPRSDEAVFEVKGPEGTIQSHVSIETVPLSENSPPDCQGDRVSQRTDGTGPAQVYLNAWCWDPDGDEFTMTGGGPGTHLDAPMWVGSTQSSGMWRYRTATSAGSETTYVWATDVLGARSNDAQVDVTVGPAVDTLPSCQPSSSWGGGVNGFPIYTRPGAIRRFGIMCGDPDGDSLSAAVTTPPANGVLTAFDLGGEEQGFWGTQRWIDATYAPAGASSQPDEFAVTASGSRGAGPNVRMVMTPVELPANSGGGSCGWSGLTVTVDTPGLLEARCDDNEGDPLQATIATAPLHGTAAPPVLTPDRFGQTRIDIPYVPNPGYKGYDCVKIVIEDGYGSHMEITFDIQVQELPPPMPPSFFPTLQPPPVLPAVKAAPPPSAAQIAQRIRAAATRALGTTSVRRLSAGATQVWVPRRLSRRTLVRHGLVPTAYVVCSVKCRLRSAVGLTGRSSASSKTHGVFAMSAWEPRLISLTVSRHDRRQLPAAHRSSAELQLSVRGGAGKPLSVSRVIAIQG